MNKFNIFLGAALVTAVASAAAIEQVIVRQQWPWSTDVKVEYKLSGVTQPVNISVKAFNGDTELDLPESAIVGDRFGITEDGVAQFLIDPIKAFGSNKIALANFKVKLAVSDAPANINEVLYKIFDLQSGVCTDVRRSDLLGGKYGTYETDFSKFGSNFSTSLSNVLIWTGVTNDVAYKTTKLVMRKVPAKDVVWTMGDSPALRTVAEVQASGSLETNHLVRLSYDYWMGVFEVTRGQFELLAGSGQHGTSETAENADVLPERKIVFGNYGAKGAYAAYFVGQLRTKTGISTFDIPSEPEWEFACRAGTSTGLYSGLNAQGGWWSGNDGRLSMLAWTAGNSGGSVHPVGEKLPNALGLYDMLGNVLEFTRNFRGANSADYLASFGADWTPESIVEDPVSPASGYHLLKGGSFGLYAAYVRAGDRTMNRQNWTTGNSSEGCRVMLRLAE